MLKVQKKYSSPQLRTGGRRNKIMADKIFENNQVAITGEIVSDFRYSHEVFGEGF